MAAIARAHGGTVEAESGAGATFRVRLPDPGGGFGEVAASAPT